MKLIYTCDNIDNKDVIPYTGVAEINQIIGKPTTIIGEANSWQSQGSDYGLVYRISVPINTQYVNKSGISFTYGEGGGPTYAKPYTDLLKATEVIEWKSYMSFYEKLIEIINGCRLPNKDWCKEINGELVIDIRDVVYEPWHYENWYAGKKYSSGEAKEYKPKRCSIKTVVSSIDE